MPSRVIRLIPWTTLRVRLTIWNTAVVLLAIFCSLGAVRLGARAALFREADLVLQGEVAEIVLALRDRATSNDQIVNELERKMTGHEARGWFSQFIDKSDKTIWKSPSCPDSVTQFPITKDRQKNLVQIQGFRFARETVAGPSGELFHIRIGMPTAFLEEDIDSLSRLLVPIGLLLGILTPLGGYWLALRATAPIAGIIKTADRLRPTRMGDRLLLRGSGDELDRLSLTINRLLDQLASHIERQEEFVANAAHELRSPLAAIQSSLEVAILQPRTAIDYQASLEDVLEQTRHLSKLVNDLMLLAESATQQKLDTAETTDFKRVVESVVSMFTGVAEEQGISLILSATHDAFVAGNMVQLRQVVSNLIDNAIRFTPHGGQISLQIDSGETNQDICLRVIDTGSGIAKEHLDRVFDRFYQSNSGRDRSVVRRGGGLGLAICKSIVEAHGGSISISSQPGKGTTILVRLLKTEPQSPRPLISAG